MLIDYHTHTYLCKHANGKPEEYLAKAESLGIDELGFSDHSPWPVGFDSEWRMQAEDMPTYRNLVMALHNKSDRVKIRYGLEIDWVPGAMGQVFANTKNEDFDYIIGSIHYVDDFPFDNPDMIDKWDTNEKIEWVWNNYANSLCEFIQTNSFDIIGHADLPKKFGRYPKSMDYFYNKMEQVFAIAATLGIAVEINTSGLRKPVGEIYPSLKILKLAKSKDVMLTMGSDAHSPDDVGANFKEGCELAALAGFSEITSFEKRKPSLHRLG